MDWGEGDRHKRKKKRHQKLDYVQKTRREDEDDEEDRSLIRVPAGRIFRDLRGHRVRRVSLGIAMRWNGEEEASQGKIRRRFRRDSRRYSGAGPGLAA